MGPMIPTHSELLGEILGIRVQKLEYPLRIHDLSIESSGFWIDGRPATQGERTSLSNTAGRLERGSRIGRNGGGTPLECRVSSGCRPDTYLCITGFAHSYAGARKVVPCTNRSAVGCKSSQGGRARERCPCCCKGCHCGKGLGQVVYSSIWPQ